MNRRTEESTDGREKQNFPCMLSLSYLTEAIQRTAYFGSWLEGRSGMMGQVWCREPEVAGQTASTVRMQRYDCCCSVHFLFWEASGTMVVTFRAGLLISAQCRQPLTDTPGELSENVHSRLCLALSDSILDNSQDRRTQHFVHLSNQQTLGLSQYLDFPTAIKTHNRTWYNEKLLTPYVGHTELQSLNKADQRHTGCVHISPHCGTLNYSFIMDHHGVPLIAFAQEMTNSKSSAALRLSVFPAVTAHFTLSTQLTPEHIGRWLVKLGSNTLLGLYGPALPHLVVILGSAMCGVMELGTGQRACACCGQNAKVSQEHVVKWSQWK